MRRWPSPSARTGDRHGDPRDVRLLGRVVAAAERAATMTDAEIDAILARAPDYSSPFERMPW